jgi:nucleotide-binding universal stress UspA family protein
MTIKRVLLPITGSSLSNSQIDAAMAAAQSLDAHIEALYIQEEIRIPSRSYGMPQYGGGLGRMPSSYRSSAQVEEQLSEQRLQASKRAREQFAMACEKAGYTLVDNGAGNGHPVASWREATGSPRKVVAEHAAEYDLVVAASGAIAGTLRDVAEAALLDAGRPVLLAPSKLQRPIAENPVIAWDESPVCWHAVSAALPFLEAAKRAQVITVSKNRDAPRDTQDRLLAYLEDHGIDAEAKVSPPLTRSIGEAILSEASERGGSMLVMGAYSHSPLAEWIFGGATRHVLKNAVATPVLLAH